MARRNSRREESTGEDDVNVTPLLDIVFIMLIFFIVTSTFIKEPGIQVQRPAVVTQEPQKPSILVAISSTDEIFINKEVVDLGEVRFRVAELRKETPRGGLVLQADRDASATLTIDVLQQIKDAGVDQAAISTVEG